jgi:hypothetical protein
LVEHGVNYQLFVLRLGATATGRLGEGGGIGQGDKQVAGIKGLQFTHVPDQRGFAYLGLAAQYQRAGVVLDLQFQPVGGILATKQHSRVGNRFTGAIWIGDFAQNLFSVIRGYSGPLYHWPGFKKNKS